MAARSILKRISSSVAHLRTVTRMLLLASSALAACGDDGIVLPNERSASAIEITGGNGQTGTVGSPLPQPVTAHVTDAQGRPVVDQQVEFTAGGGGTANPALAQTDASGNAAAQWVLGTGAGSQTLVARPVGNDAADVSATATASATAGPAVAIAAVSGTGQSAVAGTPLANPLVVQVEDEHGNPVTGVLIEWTASGGASVGEPTTTTDENGRASVTLTLGGSPGAQGAQAAADGLAGSPAEFTATATVGSAGALTISRQPSSTAQSGTAFGQQPQVQLRDAASNPVPQAGVAIQAELASGPAGSALIGSAIAATNGSGLATFSGLGITGPAGQYRINFSVANQPISGVTSNIITIAAGAPAALRFLVQPSNTSAGATISPAVRVELIDAQGNLVTNADRTVSLSLQGGPGGATLSGSTSTSTDDGVATFSNLSVNQAGSGYRLVASSSGLSGATSDPFTVSTGAATNLVFTVQPSAADAGEAISPAVRVEARDAAGNAVTGFSGQVTIGIASGPSGAVLGGNTTVAATAGVATFSDLTLDRAGTYTLRATATGLSQATSSSFSVGAGSAANVSKVAGDNGSAQVGQLVEPEPRVRVTDAGGNPVAGVTVTFAVASGGGTATGTTPTTNSSGEAEVGSWRLGTTAGTNTLTATVSGLAPVTFTATGEPASGSGLEFYQDATPQTTIASGGPLDDPVPVVQIVDAQGNPVATSGVPITISISPAGASLGGTTTRSTDASGRAAFTGITVTGAVGDYTLQFSGQGTPLTAPIAITAGGVSGARSGIQLSPGTVEALAATTVTVTAEDAAGNPVAGAGVALSAAPGPGSFGATSLVTDASGTASTTFASSALGAQTISATITGPIGGPTTVEQVVNVVAIATTTTIVSDAPDPSGPDQDVTVQFTVTASSGSPAGVVQVTSDEGASCQNPTSVGACTLDFTTAGDWTITATFPAGGAYAGSQDTEPHTVTAPPAGGPATIEIRRQPSPVARSGTRFASQPEIRVRDASGNNVAGVDVSVALASGPGTLGGRTTDVTHANGVGSWDDLYIDGVGVHTLQFTAGPVAALSIPIAVTP